MELIVDPELYQNVINAVKKCVPVLLYGKPGVGKTSLAYKVAEDLKMRVVEINASDERTKDRIEKIHSLVKSKPLVPTLILFDEVDASTPNITKILRESKLPIILTANYLGKVPEQVQELCEKYHVNPPPLGAVVKAIKTEIPGADYSNIGEDVRNSIIATKYESTRYKPTDELDFDVVRQVFVAKDITHATRRHLLWLVDNVDNFYQGAKIYTTLDIISRADCIGNIKILKALPRVDNPRGKVNFPYYLRRAGVMKSG